MMDNLNNTLFDCQRMFRHACAFAEVADLAEAKFCHDTADIEWYSTPATVNSAFACEVFLKGLLLSYGKPAGKKHKLKELYEALPEDAKEWIKENTLIHYGGNWTDTFDFEPLEKISDAFVEWRYSYEYVPDKTCSMKINIGFLIAFRNSLREACCLRLFHMKWDDYSR